MKTHVVEQGSLAWHMLRLGRPTSSEFSSILTPKTEKPAAAARGYAIRLVTETILGRPVIDLDNIKAVQRGKELEPDAVTAYEFATGLQTSPCGFVTTDDGRIGASPDRLVDGVAAAVELKCPAPHTHMGYFYDGFGPDYRLQVQGQMMVGELEWVDRVSYYPELPLVRVRSHRDEPLIEKLRSALAEFLELYDELLAEALRRGAVITPPEPLLEQPQRRPFLHTIVDVTDPAMADYDTWSAS